MRNSTAALAASAALLLLVVSPAAAATWTVSGREARLVFGAWKAKHGRTYGSVGEEERRYAIFRATLRRVDQHNAAGEAGVDVDRRGLNGFSDLTTEEWNLMCCGSLRSTRGTHYFVHLHRAYQAAAASIPQWCVGVLGGDSPMGAQSAGEAARWEVESPRGMVASKVAVVSLGSTVVATEPK